MTTKQEEGGSFLSFAGGLIVGGVIGTVVGIFLAPKSGSEMRYQLSESMFDAQNKTKQLFDETKTSIGNNVDKATKNLETTVSKVAEAFNAGRKAAQDVVSENSNDNGVAEEKNSVKIDKSDKISDKLDTSENKQSEVENSDWAKKQLEPNEKEVTKEKTDS